MKSKRVPQKFETILLWYYRDLFPSCKRVRHAQMLHRGSQKGNIAMI